MASKTRRKYNYQYGSAARNYYEAVPTPVTPPSAKRKVVPKKNLDIIFISKILACGIILFIGAFSYIHMYASFNMKQTELKRMKNEIRDLKSTISLTEAKMSEKLNLEVIRERASAELGMKEPSAHQIIYIELPKQSYTSYGE